MGGRQRQRGRKKLHLGIDAASVIMAHALTEATVDDATTGVDLIEAVHSDLASVTADAAYDTVAFYDAARAPGATVVVPPTTTAKVSRRRPRSRARDHTITEVKAIGRRQWKKASGDDRQARVENTVLRDTSIIRDRLRARRPGRRVVEACLACSALDRMIDPGNAESFAISGGRGSGWGARRVSFEPCTNAAAVPAEPERPPTGAGIAYALSSLTST